MSLSAPDPASEAEYMHFLLTALSLVTQIQPHA